MNEKDFIKGKLSIMAKDKQKGFDELVEPLSDMAQEGEQAKKVQIPADGNWFTISFEAIEIANDRLVISANRIKNGLVVSPYDPSEMQYIVEFEGTRAAYLRGYYKSYHPIGGWPYISWDIRSYANHPSSPSTRVYVRDFRAHTEIKKLILAMESVYGTKNIVNSYINDNLLRFQNGIRAKNTPQEIEKAWSRGMMESLGYSYVEAFDTSHPTGNWNGVSVHWCKMEQDLRGGAR
ncbi:MAG: hypothetical protein PVJ72_09080 [Gammaproteobacteria bacterium]|jgi:hypothetical protein